MRGDAGRERRRWPWRRDRALPTAALAAATLVTRLSVRQPLFRDVFRMLWMVALVAARDVALVALAPTALPPVVARRQPLVDDPSGVTSVATRVASSVGLVVVLLALLASLVALLSVLALPALPATRLPAGSAGPRFGHVGTEGVRIADVGPPFRMLAAVARPALPTASPLLARLSLLVRLSLVLALLGPVVLSGLLVT